MVNNFGAQKRVQEEELLTQANDTLRKKNTRIVSAGLRSRTNQATLHNMNSPQRENSVEIGFNNPTETCM